MRAVAPTVTNGDPFSRTGNERVEAEAMVVQPVANPLTARMHKGINSTLDEGQTPVLAHALRGEGFDASEDGTGRGTPLVPIGFNARQDPDCWQDRTGPLDTDGSTQAVGTDCYNGAITGDVAATLGTPGSSVNASGPTVMQAVSIQDVRAVNKAQNGKGWNDDGTAYTVDTHATQGVAVAPSLTASNDPSRSPQSAEVTQQVNAVYASSMQVRRLTPVECERLQGFPDGYTNIPWRGKPESPDGPRYKALGNSMAVPVMKWIGERIQMVQQ